MPNYILNVESEDVVRRTTTVKVSATSEADAREKVASALKDYPNPVLGDGINRMITTKLEVLDNHSFVVKKLKKDN